VQPSCLGGVAVAAIITAGSGYYAAKHFAITTDINKLIAPDIGWRHRENGYERDFPGFVRLHPGGGRGADAGARDRGERQPGEAAFHRPELFHVVRQLDGDPFFREKRFAVPTGKRSCADDARAGPGRAVIGALAWRSFAPRTDAGAVVWPARACKQAKPSSRTCNAR
jgi:hypothetical protein